MALGRTDLGSFKFIFNNKGGYNHIVMEERLADKINKKYGCLKAGKTKDKAKITIPNKTAILLIADDESFFTQSILRTGAKS